MVGEDGIGKHVKPTTGCEFDMVGIEHPLQETGTQRGWSHPHSQLQVLSTSCNSQR